ncbi:FMN-binding glutamate synthase family protein [Ornithinibacillus halotolerans]|uniref:Glutamate synthase large subunit-like protein YerD n=1 Tax=Ornithinibacillus halotolerans TaxID=1274357 RepID=A0A916RX61_9BACI|nr:FMN-binding glutamate synthase family protein [Ornithinibacillus halotolerans]GGA71773.1 glutamate synthase large subunit-like protein YerD [Ornithinibacillus halotolerans]
MIIYYLHEKDGVFVLSMLISFLKMLPFILFYGLILFIIYLYLKDKYQNQHSILKTHPLLGRLRYIFEMIGPEFRQYWFLNDKEGRPVDRDTQETIAKAGKYANTVIGFGSKKDFSKTDFYLTNSMFPLNVDELKVDNRSPITTYTYQIINESITSRKEKRNQKTIKPWHLTKDNSIVIGERRNHPFKVKGLLGISAMSYGALSKSAVKALSQGVAISGGSFMNTGEGGISPYHLSKVYQVLEGTSVPTDRLEKKVYCFIKEFPHASNFQLEKKFGEEVKETIQQLVDKEIIEERGADLIFQVGSGLFGARKDGKYCEETFLSNALRPEVKAIELKLAQGAKVRGGKLPKEKITPEIASIRGIEMGKDVESPNRFPLFKDMDGLFTLIRHWQEITGKPVGIKVVAGDEYSFDNLASYMKETGEAPDFISIDGAEGGTGATYQEMADGLGLPIYSGILILDQTLRKYGVRDDVKIIASGMLATANKMATALSLGADLIYVARAAMNTVGCINAGKCHTNLCPVGITTHLPHLEAGLAVEEKRFRTANYLTTMREGLFMLGASCGIDSPTKFGKEHIALRRSDNEVKKYTDNTNLVELHNSQTTIPIEKERELVNS